MATKEDNRRCTCFAEPIGILQLVDTKEKKNTETEPILRLVLPTGGGPSNKFSLAVWVLLVEKCFVSYIWQQMNGFLTRMLSDGE